MHGALMLRFTHRVDATLKVGIGDLNNPEKILGCHVSLWTSDSHIACRIFPKWESVASLGEIEAAAPGSLVCTTCLAPLVTVGCSTTSTGYCELCRSCDIGRYRFGCVPGGTSAGVCRPCKTLPETPNGERTFKSTRGTPLSSCSKCTVCGGGDQDGTQYHVRACTDRNNTVCQDCPSCGPGRVRVGCAEDWWGICTESVQALKATANVNLEHISTQNSDLSLKILEDYTLRLLGERSHTGFKVKYNSLVAVGPPPWILMMSSVHLLDNQISQVDLIESGVQILSDALLLSPDGLVFSPAGILTTRLTTVDGMVGDSATHEPILARWDGNQWIRKAQLIFDSDRAEIQGDIDVTGIYIVVRVTKPRRDQSPFKVVLSLGLPMSQAEFDSAKQGILLSSLAAAAQVTAALVRIVSIEETARRAPGIKIDVEVRAPTSDNAAALAGRLTLDNINTQLSKAGLPAAILLEPPTIQESGLPTMLWETEDPNLFHAPHADPNVGLSLVLLVVTVCCALIGAIVVHKKRSARASTLPYLDPETVKVVNAGLELGGQVIPNSENGAAPNQAPRMGLSRAHAHEWRPLVEAQHSDAQQVSPSLQISARHVPSKVEERQLSVVGLEASKQLAFQDIETSTRQPLVHMSLQALDLRIRNNAEPDPPTVAQTYIEISGGSGVIAHQQDYMSRASSFVPLEISSGPHVEELVAAAHSQSGPVVHVEVQCAPVITERRASSVPRGSELRSGQV